MYYVLATTILILLTNVPVTAPPIHSKIQLVSNVVNVDHNVKHVLFLVNVVVVSMATIYHRILVLGNVLLASTPMPSYAHVIIVHRIVVVVLVPLPINAYHVIWDIRKIIPSVYLNVQSTNMRIYIHNVIGAINHVNSAMVQPNSNAYNVTMCTIYTKDSATPSAQLLRIWQ